MKNKLQKIKNFLLDILFPPLCLSCEKIINQKKNDGTMLCSKCLGKLKKYNHPIKTKEYLVFSTTPYNGVSKKIIKTFKYRKIKTATQTIQELLIKPYVKKNIKYFKNKEWLIIPVPIHPSKKRKRGFNQSLLIAKALQYELKDNNIKSKTKTNLLKKIKKTRPQAKLSLKERRKNTKDSFFLEKESHLKNKNIIIVDDVYTTGSTIKQCLKIIKEIKPREIKIFTLAKTKH